jgi:hypothetical protein
VVREIKRVPRSQGVNRINWDLAYDGPRARRDSGGPGDAVFGVGEARGPQAVPGKYTVRLTVGAERLEKPLEVKLDPASEVTVAELKEQFDAALKIREMRTAMNDTLRAVDAFRAQLVGRRNSVATLRSDARGDQLKVIDREIAGIDSLLSDVAIPPGHTFWSEGPRITERLGQLFTSLDGPNRAPTPHQLKLMGELELEWKEALAKIGARLGKIISDARRGPRSEVVAP